MDGDVTAHTPGPWGQKYTEVSPEGAYHIRDAKGRRVTLAYTKADARLIAAAPEQNEALHECVTMLDSVARAMEQIATLGDAGFALEFVRNTVHLRETESKARAAIAKAEATP